MTEEKPTALAVAETAGVPQAFTLVPHTLSEAMEFAKLIATSNLCPPDYRGKPADVLMAVQLGLEVAGCSPLQALQNIAVINGRPSMWGDLVLGVVRNSGLLASIDERDPQEAFAKKEGRCAVLRRGEDKEVVRTFTLDMANAAGLVQRSGSSGPWKTHPGRMLQMRARSWALRDAFGDVLRGLRIREEEVDAQITATPIRTTPRRKSETAAIDEFLGEKAPAAAPATTSDMTATEAEAAAQGTVWSGTITGVTSKTGKKKSGADWTLYIVQTEGGDFGTFSESIADEARLAFEHQIPVTIAWSLTEKGGRNIDRLDPHEEQGGDE